MSVRTMKAATGSAGDLGRAATTGMMWLLIQSVSTRIVGFLSQLALAWLLAPADFGVIGLAYTVTTLTGALVTFGVDDVLLQRQRTIPLWSATAFWISLALGFLGMVVMLVAAPIAAISYGNPKLVGLITILAIAVPIGACATVPMVKIRADMNFRFLAAYNTFEIIVLQLGTILLAWAGFGAYSFVIPVPLLAIVKACLYWRKAPPVIWRRLRMSQMRYLLGSSTIVFATRLLIEIVNQTDYIVLGVVASQTVVGYYFFAFRFALQPVRILAGNLNNIMFPAFAQLRSDPIRQTAAALKVSRLLSYLVVPFCFLQAALAGPGLTLLFGSKWHNAVHLVQILSIGLPFDAVGWITGSLLIARREFRRSFRYALISVPLFLVLVLIGARLDLTIGVAWSVDLYYMVFSPICSYLILREGDVGLAQITDLYFTPACLAAGTIGAAYLLSLLPIICDSDIARVVVIMSVGPMLYSASLYLLRKDVFDQASDRVMMMANRFNTRLA